MHVSQTACVPRGGVVLVSRGRTCWTPCVALRVVAACSSVRSALRIELVAGGGEQSQVHRTEEGVGEPSPRRANHEQHRFARF